MNTPVLLTFIPALIAFIFTLAALRILLFGDKFNRRPAAILTLVFFGLTYFAVSQAWPWSEISDSQYFDLGKLSEADSITATASKRALDNDGIIDAFEYYTITQDSELRKKRRRIERAKLQFNPNPLPTDHAQL